MSKWMDKDVKKIIKDKVSNIQLSRKMLKPEEIEEIMPEVVKHFKKHPDDRDVFQDKYGGTILLIEVPKEAKPNVTNSAFSEGEQWQIMCKSKLGLVSVFGDRVNFWEATTERGEAYFVRGSLKEQYDIIGTWGVGKMFSTRQYFKSLEDACKKTGTEREKLDEDDISRTYTFNAWQNMG